MTGITTGRRIRVLVVDDSAFMRKALTMMLESDPAIEVIGTARDGEEGIDKVRRLKPDLVTMDIEMPRMDGLAALRQIMLNNPVPVMMISSLTTDGAQATLEALEMGAVDFIPKALSYVSLDIVKIKDDLLAKIKDIVSRKSILMSRHRLQRSPTVTKPSAVTRSAQAPSTPARAVRKRNHQVSLVAIGSSTGGPPALQQIIPRLPRNFPVGIIIAQHMPPIFTKSLADRLNGLSQVTVREAEDGEQVQPGLVLIAPGGQHMTVKKYGARSTVVVSSEPADTLYHPCVDVTMNSVAEAYGGAALGVILTGMGNNGAKGIELLKSKGGVVIAQNEQTCVVYGMPRAVIDAGLADIVAPIDDLVDDIVSFF